MIHSPALIYYQEFNAWLSSFSGLSSETLHKLHMSILAILLLYSIKLIVQKIVYGRTESPSIRYHWMKAAAYGYFSLLILVLLRIWFEASWPLGNIFALSAAALTLALQDFVKSFAAWLYIIWRKPFSVGDRIRVGDVAGDVIDISMMRFSLNEIGEWVDSDQSTGRIIHVGNNRILNNPIINFTEGFPYIWEEIPVLVTFESNWRKAKKIILEVIEKHSVNSKKISGKTIRDISRKYMIFYHKVTPIVYTSVKDCGVLLTARLVVEPRQRRIIDERVWEDILTEFEKYSDIDFAYPTQRFFDNRTEAKKPSSEPVIIPPQND
jgi:small-conductance mechanosensitive channel